MATNFNPLCPLCQLEKETRWYYEDASFVVLDCNVCYVPMAVWREHGETEQDSSKYAEMLNKLAEVANQTFGKGNWWLDPVERSVPGHRHAHARPKWGWW